MINIMPYIITYTCVWWFLFFISLPIGIKEEVINNDDKQYKKEVTNAYIFTKIIIVTILSTPLTYYLKLWFDKMLLNLL